MKESKYIFVDKITLDENGILYVKPDGFSFEKIHRSAMGVRWDIEKFALYTDFQIDKQWGVLQCYGQVLSAAKDEYGKILKVNKDTIFENISVEEKLAIEVLEWSEPIQEKHDINNEPIITIKKSRKIEYVFYPEFIQKKKNNVIESVISVDDIYNITYNIRYSFQDFLWLIFFAYGGGAFQHYSRNALVIDLYPKNHPIILKLKKEEYLMLKEKLQKRINLI